MKIQFENNLNHQNKAINSIVDIFEGQEICQSNFSISRVKGDALGVIGNAIGDVKALELPYSDAQE